MNIAELIKMQRKAAGLSRNQLAEFAGVGKTLIYDLEHQDTNIRLDGLLKVLKVLNIQLFAQPATLPEKVKLNIEKEKAND